MSQKVTVSLLEQAAADVAVLIYYQDLIVLALGQADSCEEIKFERLWMLVEIYRSYADTHLESIQSVLNQLLKLTSK